MHFVKQSKMWTQPTFFNLHPNECSQGFHYYPFWVRLGRCVRSCNTLDDLSSKLCVPSKTEDLNLSMFNMITEIISESQILAKDIQCECNCRFDGKRCNSNQWWNNDKGRCECKKRHIRKKITFGILLHVVVEMENI